MLDRMVCNEDRHKLLNILCKTCSRHRMIPTSIHMDKRLSRELIEEDSRGQANIFRTEHNGRQAAVKTVRIYLTSDFEKCFSVSKALAPEVLIDRPAFAEIMSRSCCMEASPTPKHPPVARCGFGKAPACNDIRVDGPRKYQLVCEET